MAHEFSSKVDWQLRDVRNARKTVPITRIIVWTLIILTGAWFIYAASQNPNFGWPVVFVWLTEVSVMKGLTTTLWLTFISMILGIVLGLLVAVARLSHDRLAQAMAALYIWFFRGTPLLVQLIFWYNLSILVPHISIGIPFGPTFISWNTNDLITPVTAAIAGLTLNEAAYMAEIIRAGLLSVSRGQYETCDAFGMTKLQALRRIILPQAMRSIVPPTGNQLISMIKSTSLVSVIAMSDLLYSVQAIYNRTFEVIPMLMVAVIWYLIVTSILNVGQGFIERYYGRSDRGNKVRVAQSLGENHKDNA